MSKITIQSEIDAKTLLLGVSKLNISDLEEFIRELSGIVTRKRTKDKKYQIAALLNKHNLVVLSKEKRSRYAELYEKLEADTMTKVEQQEFLVLTGEEEKLRNERLKLLI